MYRFYHIFLDTSTYSRNDKNETSNLKKVNIISHIILNRASGPSNVLPINSNKVRGTESFKTNVGNVIKDCTQANIFEDVPLNAVPTNEVTLLPPNNLPIIVKDSEEDLEKDIKNNISNFVGYDLEEKVSKEGLVSISEDKIGLWFI